MSVLEAGDPSRPAIIFLHGLGTGARAWKPQMDALSDEYHLLSVYQPGYGNSPGPFTLERAVAALDSVFERHGMERAHLCGLSLGTMVTLTYALRDPGRLLSLSLCGGFARLTEEMRAMSLAGAASMREAQDDIVRNQIVLNFPEEYRSAALEDLASVSGADLASISEQIVEFDVADRLPEIHIPTLVLCGEHDHYNLPFCEALAEGISGARLAIIPDAGHVANLDNPAAFTEALTRFLGGVGEE